MPKIRIKVLRAFLLGGKPQQVGDEVEVDAATAAELMSMNKAERVAASPAQAKPAPAKTAPAKAAAQE